MAASATRGSLGGLGWEDLSGRVHGRASALSRINGASAGGSAEDSAQEALVRFFGKKLASRVDPAKGDALSLLNGVLRNVERERVRSESRTLTPYERSGEARFYVAAPLEALLRDEQTSFLKSWFWQLTHRQRMAMARLYGPLFGFSASGDPEPRDYVAACNARRKLRERAACAGLRDV
jgi:DNA-directed RNA polymerase specialized sigma24 family protein